MMRSFLLAGQARVHFTSESAARREQILQSIAELRPMGLVVTSHKRGGDAEARRRCLGELTAWAIEMGVSRLVLELDDSSLALDKHLIFETSRTSGAFESFSYGWQKPHQEPILWMADALAWSWAHDGPWRQNALRAFDIAVRQV